MGLLLSGSASSGTGIGVTIIYLVLIILFFYFFLIRPSRKEEKNKKALLSRLEIGDSVLTSSGFYGVVIDIADDTVKPAEETKTAAPSDDDKKDKKKGFLKK